MLCVSHSPEMLRQMCSKGILLDHGQVICTGALEDVLAVYQGRVSCPTLP